MVASPLAARAENPLVSGPILPALLRLTLPNLAAMLVMALVAISETVYVGILGTTPLAAIALVFPHDHADADAVGGSDGRRRLLGDQPGARSRRRWRAPRRLPCTRSSSARRPASPSARSSWRSARRSCARWAAAARCSARRWSTPTSHSPARSSLAAQHAGLHRARHRQHAGAVAHAARRVRRCRSCSAARLGLGIGPIPRLGLAGVATGLVVAYALARALPALVPPLRARAHDARIRRAPARGARCSSTSSRSGAVASFSPLQTVLTVLILTRLVAGFGTEALAGYGIGARLEFLLVPDRLRRGRRQRADGGHGDRRPRHRARPAGGVDRRRRSRRHAGCDRARRGDCARPVVGTFHQRPRRPRRRQPLPALGRPRRSCSSGWGSAFTSPRKAPAKCLARFSPGPSGSG